MREIKFRAWGNSNFPETCKMYSWKDLMEWDKLWMFFNESGQPANAWVLMQFTGLLDKNGKEVFDGDILKVKWHIKNDSHDSEWKTEEHIAGVGWWSNGWKIKWSYFSKPFEIDGNKELCWYDDYNRSNQPGAYHKLTDFEVLGNIYEHHHLLEPT